MLYLYRGVDYRVFLTELIVHEVSVLDYWITEKYILSLFQTFVVYIFI